MPEARAFLALAKDAMVMVTVKQDNADFVFRFWADH